MAWTILEESSKDNWLYTKGIVEGKGQDMLEKLKK